MSSETGRSKNNEAIYKDAGYWWWRNPTTGVLEGPFNTREQGRRARRQAKKAATTTEKHTKAA